MQTITIPERTFFVYEFGELSEDAKKFAREHFREHDAMFMDETTWEDVVETARQYGVKGWSYDYGYANVDGMSYWEPDCFPEEHMWSDFVFMDTFRNHMSALVKANEIADRLDTYDGYQKLYEFYDRLAQEAMQRLYDLYESDCEYHRSEEFIDEWLGDGDELFYEDGTLYAA